MMAETKEIDVRALASLTAGRLLIPQDEGGFSRVHEAAEWLLGAPIWTHHFADRSTCEKLASLAWAQFPDLPKQDSQRTPWAEVARCAVDRYGPAVSVIKGDGSGGRGPLDHLPERFLSRPHSREA